MQLTYFLSFLIFSIFSGILAANVSFKLYKRLLEPDWACRIVQLTVVFPEEYALVAWYAVDLNDVWDKRRADEARRMEEAMLVTGYEWNRVEWPFRKNKKAMQVL